ncbi:hypothetical protein NQ317_005639 [Molorchus minor]|uniref:Uncharacterized protein n=1 Tax=Molorchus minor TaxID=1323400 RepID=A0ABQ9K9G7_9CUCU|nr:hypothetical protein NQ317_005639 [Molorchus minor]
MGTRNTQPDSQSPCYNVHIELDNKALKAKNTILTQTGDSFEINSRYNNLKNVISIIDSTTKNCLPKLNEVVETFTGIIQLCSVAANISNSSPCKDRTQAVKPQIVNGHVLLNPTITLSRLGDDASFTPPRSSNVRNTQNVTAWPGTSRERESSSGNDNNGGDNNGEDEGEHDTSIVCMANRGVCSRRPTYTSNNDMLRNLDEDPDSSEDELDMPVVRIYLNQLPNTYVEKVRGNGNFSISVSPPERRSSFKHRSSSLVGEANESHLDNNHSFFEDNVSPLNRSARVTQRATNESKFKGNKSNVRLSQSISQDFLTPSTSGLSDKSPESKSRSINGLNMDLSDASDTTLTLCPQTSMENSANQTSNFESPNRYVKLETRSSLKNITKRRNARDKRKVAHVVLKRLSLEKRRSDSPLKIIMNETVRTPPITKLSEMRTRSKSRGSQEGKGEMVTDSPVKGGKRLKDGKKKRRKYDSPTTRPGDLKKVILVKPKVVSPSKKSSSPGRPKRAARPMNMKEPNLTKKMRRSR